ncbi:Heavy metal-associated isoprenylated plant protein 39, partial [Linum grandiflorum]
MHQFCWFLCFIHVFLLQKIVLRVDIHDDEVKRKAMEAVSDLLGIDFIGIEMEEQKLTVIGKVDPAEVVSKLNECCSNQILTVESLAEEQKEKEDLNDKVEEENWIAMSIIIGFYLVLSLTAVIVVKRNYSEF